MGRMPNTTPTAPRQTITILARGPASQAKPRRRCADQQADHDGDDHHAGQVAQRLDETAPDGLGRQLDVAAGGDEVEDRAALGELDIEAGKSGRRLWHGHSAAGAAVPRHAGRTTDLARGATQNFSDRAEVAATVRYRRRQAGKRRVADHAGVGVHAHADLDPPGLAFSILQRAATEGVGSVTQRAGSAAAGQRADRRRVAAEIENGPAADLQRAGGDRREAAIGVRPAEDLRAGAVERQSVAIHARGIAVDHHALLLLESLLIALDVGRTPQPPCETEGSPACRGPPSTLYLPGTPAWRVAGRSRLSPHRRRFAGMRSCVTLWRFPCTLQKV